MAAAGVLAERGIDATVVDVRSLVPLDTQTILREVSATGRMFTVEENPRLCGWGAELVSIVAEECFDDLDGPPLRITTPHIPLPVRGRARGHGHPVGRACRRHHRAGDAVMTATTPRTSAVDAPTQLMIGGAWVDASDGRTFDGVRPGDRRRDRRPSPTRPRLTASPP